MKTKLNNYWDWIPLTEKERKKDESLANIAKYGTIEDVKIEFAKNKHSSRAPDYLLRIAFKEGTMELAKFAIEHDADVNCIEYDHVMWLITHDHHYNSMHSLVLSLLVMNGNCDAVEIAGKCY